MDVNMEAKAVLLRFDEFANQLMSETSLWDMTGPSTGHISCKSTFHNCSQFLVNIPHRSKMFCCPFGLLKREQYGY
jgi:hypothetical protein